MSGKWLIFFFILVIIFTSFFLVSEVEGKNTVSLSDLELAKYFTPALYFHEDEVFRPQPVEVFIENARLRKNLSFWFDLNLLNSVVSSDLVTYQDPHFFLDIWYGSARQSDYKNYTAHRAYYAQYLSPDAGGLPTTIYARVIHDDFSNKTIIQYWLFYFYNDWFNKHEGDWEMVQIVLDNKQNPEWVILSQHHGGTRRQWRDTRIEETSHPSVFVALGSHANYFWGNEIYPNSMEVGTKRVEMLDRTGDSERIIPEVILLPSSEDITSTLDEYSNAAWLIFNGNWGELSLQGDFGGPGGPTTKGNQWEKPYRWGMDQPLDDKTWYLNRFKIHVGSDQIATFKLQSDQILSQNNIDIGSNFLIYHDEPPKNLSTNIEAFISPETTISATWPQQEVETIERYQFSNINENEMVSILLQFANGKDPVFWVGDSRLQPITKTIQHTTWDAPDLVWFAGYLPASEIVLGLVTAIVAGIIPGLLFIILIYRFDRYEKEPLKLVFTALLWGIAPSILVEILVQVFFSIPPEALSPEIIEAAQTGLIAPFTEEAIKGAVLIFIATRHRKEVNDVLDGIIYGAIVGIGFAISGNTIGYIGSFLVRGFQGLGIIIFMEGFLSGLNHALYSSIFGAGLAYFITKNKGGKYLWIPAGTFLLAVCANGLHELLTSSILNQPILGFIVNWSGIIGIVVIMILEREREKRIIREYLNDEISRDGIQVIFHTKYQKPLYRDLPLIPRYKLKRTLKSQITLLTKLAFFKKFFSQNPTKDTKRDIQNIRDQIMKLDQQTQFLTNFRTNPEILSEQ